LHGAVWAVEQLRAMGLISLLLAFAALVAVALVCASLVLVSAAILVLGWRSVFVYFCALRIHFSYAVIRRCEPYLSEHRITSWKHSTHEANAEFIYQQSLKLQGLFIKACQYVSSRSDVFPDEYIHSLSRCQDACTPRDFEITRQTICSEFQVRNLFEIFDSFDETPIACASIAQVHKAVYRGKSVAVKVQHVDIESIVVQDIKVIERIAEAVAWLTPQYDFRSIVYEWTSEVPKELDFRLEAYNMRQVESAMKPFRFETRKESELSIEVEFPQIVCELPNSRRVYVMSFVDGCKVTDTETLDAHHVDLEWLLTQCARAFACQVFIDGCFSADPHPGNILVKLDNSSGSMVATPVLLDFGLTKILDDNTRLAFAKMVLSAEFEDIGSLINAFDEMGLILASSFREIYSESLQMTRFFFRDSQPKAAARQEYRSEMKSRRQRMKRIQQDAEIKLQSDTSLQRNPIEAFPGSFIFFSRMLFLLRGLATRLEVRQQYLSILRPFAHLALVQYYSKSSVANQLVCREVKSAVQLQKRASALLEKLSESGAVFGAQVCMFYRGTCVLNLPFGKASPYSDVDVTPHTLFNAFSVSKAFTAVLLWSLHDHGMIDSMDDYVALYWPAFRNKNKEHVRISHLLSHSAGLSRAGQDVLMKQPFEIMDWNRMKSIMENAEPAHEPGLRQEYHALSFGWLLGVLAESAGGKTSFSELLQSEIVAPLGLTGEAFIGMSDVQLESVKERLSCLKLGFDTNALREKFSTLSDEQKKKLKLQFEQHTDSSSVIEAAGTNRDCDEEQQEQKRLASMPSFFNYNKVRQAQIPAANGHFTAYAIAQLFDVIANDGMCCSTNQRILHPGTSERIINGTAKDQPFGLGLRKHDHESGKRRVSHGGLGGAFGYADLDSRFSLGVTVNQLNAVPLVAQSMLKLASFQFSDVKMPSLQPGADFLQ